MASSSSSRSRPSSSPSLSPALRPLRHLCQLVGQADVPHPQGLLLDLAHVLLHLLDLGGAELVALAGVLVVGRQLPRHLLPPVRRARRPRDRPPLRGEELDVAHGHMFVGDGRSPLEGH